MSNYGKRYIEKQSLKRTFTSIADDVGLDEKTKEVKFLSVNIFELHHDLYDENNFQSRVIEYESFEKYVEDLKQFRVYKVSGYFLPRTVEILDFNVFNNRVEVMYKRPIHQDLWMYKAWVINFIC